MAEPSWDDVEAGDKVTVEFAGSVVDGGCVLEALNGKRFFIRSDGFRSWATLKSVEKPVRTFKPGDVVRAKGNPDAVYTIGDGCYWYHSKLLGTRKHGPGLFWSEDYELVD